MTTTMRQSFLAVTLISIILLSSACVSGPKRENDTFFDRLNGHNYEGNDGASGTPTIPLSLSRAAPVRKLSGIVVIETAPQSQGMDALPEPFRYQTLVLLKNDREFLRTMTNSNGEFSFDGDIQNGTYTIVVMNERHPASQVINISHYKTKDIKITVPYSR